MSTDDQGIGKYESGIRRQEEAVVSAHFMHRQNSSDAALYGADRFAAESIYISPLDVKNNLIPLLKDASQEVIQKRKQAAIERAKRNFQQYDLQSPNAAGTAEFITEVLFDDWFKKGSVSKEDRVHFRDHIRTQLDKGEPIKMVIPMLPNKAPCPLKTRGKLPCMAEAGLLARLGEVAGIVNGLYHEGKPETANKQMAQFIVVGDGKRFKNTLKTPEPVIESYQRALRWWTKQLGLEQAVVITDFEYLLDQSLSGEQKQERQRHYQDALALLNDKLGKVLDPMDVEGSLKKAVHLDPYPEDTNPEGRFVPLFKSTVYNVHYDILSKITDTKMLGADEYNMMYRDLTQHLFTPYVDIGGDDCERIRSYILEGKAKCTHPPTVPEVKEYVRRKMLQEAWQSTLDYLALVIADRTLVQDPINHAMPDAIRFSIHAKPGQIALAADSSSSSSVQAWHGTSVLRPSGNKIKLSNDSALNLEGLGAKPVRVRHNDGDAKSQGADDVLEQFASSDQPLFYIHPSLEFYDTPTLKQRFTRCK